MIDALTIAMNGIENRVQTDQLVVLNDGREWDLENSSPDIYVDFVTFTAMLMPLPLTTQWSTGPATGNYARLKKADLLLTSSAWQDFSVPGFQGDNYVYSNSINEKVYTGQSWESNQPMYLSWFAFNSGNDRQVQMECGWAEGSTADIRLRFWTTGEVEIWRNGLKLSHTGNITTPVPYPTKYQVQGGGGTQTSQSTVNVLLIPCRKRELLVLSNLGGGFNSLFEDISEFADFPDITGAGRFWFYVPLGAASVQVAPCRFKTSGYVIGPETQLRFKPVNGAPHFDFAYNNVRNSNSTATATPKLTGPDGSTAWASGTDCFMRVDMAGDGTETPFLYGGQATFDPVIVQTPDNTFVLDDYHLAQPPATMEFSESPAGTKFTFSLKNPALLATHVPKVDIVSNRPVTASLGAGSGTTSIVFQGRTPAAKFHQGIRDDVSRLKLECRDWWQVYEQYRFQESIPLDGMLLDEAIYYLATLPGFSAGQMNIEPVDFYLPGVDAASKGEWANLPQVGDTIADWLLKLHKTYAARHYIGWVPNKTGAVFQFISPEGLGTTPLTTLYLTSAESIAAGNDKDAYWTWVTEWDEDIFEPEANDIYVVGKNPREPLPIRKHYANLPSMNPLTPPATQPDDWLGEPRRLGYLDPTTTTDEGLLRTLGVLRDRLGVKRKMAEWTGQFLRNTDGSPMWRGDCVRIYGKGVYRLNTGGVTFQVEIPTKGVYGNPGATQDGTVFRPTKYTAEWVAA